MASFFSRAKEPETGRSAVAHSQRAAYDRLLAAVAGPDAHVGLICVCGPPGSGRSALLERLAETLRAAGRNVVQMRGPPGAAVPDVLLLDDAGMLTDIELLTLGRHPNACVVVGDRDLADRLLSLSVALRLVVLPPAPPPARAPDPKPAAKKAAAATAEQLVAKQLAQAGLPPDVVQPAALAAFTRHARGMPERLRVVADLAVFMARVEDADCITAEHVERAAAMADDSKNGYAAEDAADDISVDVPRRVSENEPQDAAPAARPEEPAVAPRAPLLAPVSTDPPVSPQTWFRLAGAGALVLALLAALWQAGGGLATWRAQSVAPAVLAGLPAAAPATPRPVPPVETLPHVLVTYPPGDGPAQARALQIVHQLRAAHYDVEPQEMTPNAPRRDSIHYFRAADGAAADKVAANLVQMWSRAAAPHYAETPGDGAPAPPGLVEIAVAGAAGHP